MKVKIVILALIFLSSCSTQKVVLQDDFDPEYHPSFKRDQDFFVRGPFQSKDVSVKQPCDSLDRTHSVQARTSFANGIIGGITFGIYTPREASIFCVDEEDS